jgi:hypothetical protein
MVAVKHGHLECVKSVLGRAPIDVALRVALVRDVNGGAPQRAHTLAHCCEDTILHRAVSLHDLDIALWLLRRFGKSIANAANNDNVIPLHLACAYGRCVRARVWIVARLCMQH